METTDKYIGQMLDNRYEILEKIGSGGMAVVYKARCHRLNRLVAVKILKDELAGDPDFRRRFHSESQAVAMLSHPNIVAVYDVSRTGNVEYIVMELIEGITLKQYIDRKGLLNWKEALHFSTQVAKALSHAHSRGIIHRDIKPHNIMILKDGSVKVADFGIARLQSTQNTLTQEALGSVHYISPEQAKGSHVDARSDIYSLGVVMYEMLTSHLPFEGDSAVSIAIQHISAIPLMPREINPDIPVGLEAITMHAMEPDLNLRYASADDLLHDLEEFRKNPAADFSHLAAGASSRAVPDQATREVPSGAINRADVNLPRPVRTPRPPEPAKSKSEKSPKRTRTTGVIAVLSVVVFLIAILLFLYFVILPHNQQQTLTIPKFVGLTYTEVINDPDNKEYYNFQKVEQYDDTADAGVIITQDPQADRQRTYTQNQKIDVQLVVSKGKEPAVTMPDVVNKDYREASNQLSNLNLDLVIKETPDYSNDITKDYVIKTIPEANEPLTKGETIYITYSQGPEVKMTTVPDCSGQTLTAAILRLEGYHLDYDVRRETSATVPKNEVISQDLEPSTSVQEGTKVVLMVSDGPAETSASPSPGTTNNGTTPSPTPSTGTGPTTEPSPSVTP